MGKAKGASRAPEGERADALLTTAKGARGALAARFEALLEEAATLQRKIATDFWQLGRVLLRLRDERAHVALGYDRFDAMVAERLGIATTTAFKLVAVAERLPRVEAARLGQEKAYALLAYAEAAPAEASPADLAREDAVIAGKPLSQVTVREIVAATAAARPKRPPTLAARAAATESRARAIAVAKRLGVGRGAVTAEGDGVVIRLTRRQVARLLRG